MFLNGAKMDKKHYEQLYTFPGDSSHDRLFINTHFMMIFSRKYILKQSKRGLNRKTTLDKFRDSNRYELMHKMYEYRVLSNGRDNIKARLGLFKLVYRSKFNNFWENISRKLIKVIHNICYDSFMFIDVHTFWHSKLIRFYLFFKAI